MNFCHFFCFLFLFFVVVAFFCSEMYCLQGEESLSFPYKIDVTCRRTLQLMMNNVYNFTRYCCLQILSNDRITTK